MGKRRSERIVDSLNAELILDGTNYSGIIMNFSENGLYLVSATVYSGIDIPSNSMVGLKSTLPSGEVLMMDCEVKWLQTKPSPFGVTFSMGMEIKSPPQEYREFLRTLRR